MSNHPHSALTPAPLGKQLTVRQMLERWGLRVCGGTLKSPLKISTGGEPAADDDLRLVDYVESIPGFDRARPVLQHRFVNGLPLQTFRLRHPGETRPLALIRLGWFGLIGLPDARIPDQILKEFEEALAERMRISPFILA